MVGMTQALTTQFKSCRLLLGNVWHKKLSIGQRRILRNLGARRDPGVEMFHSPKVVPFLLHRRERTTSEFVPFLLDQARLGVLLVRTHFCQSIPQARKLISHQRKFGDLFSAMYSKLWLKSRISPSEWLRLLKTKVGSRILMKSDSLRELHSTTQEAVIEKSKKTGSAANAK
ncbi:hypothetical protein MKW98_016198 [Papaver atlanticum]|uniref:Uncharacterized protein n=1 Tax=Papaver atlanticum TaxID=357466 RepID=A0AAD4SI70_9MAGN|nr:hypothetical protein MKW98_016198 [Papaver atlanticum]